MASISSSALPDNILRCMDKAQRKPLGKAGMTTSEATEKYLAGEEKRLQSDIRSYLRLHDIWTDYDSMSKRRTGTSGAPDFIFAYRGKPCGVEAKTSAGKLSSDQVDAHELMRKNGWIVIIARSVSDVQELLREIDASSKP